MANRVKLFKVAIDDVEREINRWARREKARILGTSVCYILYSRNLFVLVTYETSAASQMPLVDDPMDAAEAS